MLDSCFFPQRIRLLVCHPRGAGLFIPQQLTLLDPSLMTIFHIDCIGVFIIEMAT